MNSKSVRESIADYYAQLHGLNQQVDFYRPSSKASLHAAGDAISRFYAPDEQLRSIKYHVNVEQLSQNPADVNEFLRSYSDQFIFNAGEKDFSMTLKQCA
jgi:hypothetical protein